ncbi:MAG: NAD-binding protein [Armatimonadetes bacterium]|nr:NAD-binding protein [Armatimonadota bacterium]
MAQALQAELRQLLWIARRENVPRLAAIGFTVMAILATICFAFEYGRNEQFQSVWDALWWAFVTVMTVGYGDKYPTTWPARFFAVWLMAHGVLMMSFLTAAIASVMVERKMREDKGLGLIQLRGHFVVCGWNSHAERILAELFQQRKGELHVVLVCDLEEQMVNDLAFRFPRANIRFVKGDFTQETTLRRANVQNARAVVVLADPGSAGTAASADQRTIIAALAVKTVAPDAVTCAELLDPGNREHLERAKVDGIIVTGEYTGFLLANAALAPGVPEAAHDLLTGTSGHALAREPIPREFVGRSFRDLSAHLRQRQGALVIGLLRERKSISLDDILGSDYSAIDLFIKRKFEEAEKDYFAGGDKAGLAVQINPPDDHIVREDEAALVIARR